MTKPYKRVDKAQAAVLLVDHQAGPLSLVRDIPPDQFKNNVLAVEGLGTLFSNHIPDYRNLITSYRALKPSK